MIPMAVIGLVMDAMRNSVSFAIGFFPATSRCPTASNATIPSFRPTTVTVPDSSPSSTNFCIAVGIALSLSGCATAGSAAGKVGNSASGMSRMRVRASMAGLRGERRS